MTSKCQRQPLWNVKHLAYVFRNKITSRCICTLCAYVFVCLYYWRTKVKFRSNLDSENQLKHMHNIQFLLCERKKRGNEPRCRIFLQFKGLSGGLLQLRAAYEDAGNCELSESETQKIHKIIQEITWGENQSFRAEKKLSFYIQHGLKETTQKNPAPFVVLSTDCFPVPRRVCTPETRDGTALSRICPICIHICSKWSGAMCLLAATWQSETGQWWVDVQLGEKKHPNTGISTGFCFGKRGRKKNILHVCTLRHRTNRISHQLGFQDAFEQMYKKCKSIGIFFIIMQMPQMIHTFVLNITFSLLENTACQRSSVRIISGRTVCGFICASTSVPVGVAYYANHAFNGPIRARGTCKETRRQRASASDWPAGPSQRSKSRTTHPICSRKSPA